MSDRPLVIKGPISRNVSDLLCVVMIVSWQILVYPILLNKVRARKSGWKPKVGVRVFCGLD